jgi:hypothetical protein
LISGNIKVNENLHPKIQKALSECIQGAEMAEIKALDYFELSQGESDDSIYEACRSMHRFYSTMYDYFLEEQREIIALLEENQQGAAA